MKATIDRTALARAAKLTAGVAKPGTIAELSAVLIEASSRGLDLRATDLESGVMLELEARDITEGVVAVSASGFHSVVSRLSDETVTLSLLKKRLRLECGHSSAELARADHENFPVWPEYELTDSTKVSESEATVAARTLSPLKQNLAIGALVERLKACLKIITLDGTGGRLAIVEIKRPESDALFSRSVARERLVESLSSVGDIAELAAGDRLLAIRSGPANWVVREVESSVPTHWEKILKEPEGTARLDKLDALVEAVALARSVAPDNDYREIELKFSGHGVTVEAESPEGESSSRVECDYSGPDRTIRMQSRYVLDALRVTPKETLLIEMTDTMVTFSGVTDELSWKHVCATMVAK